MKNPLKILKKIIKEKQIRFKVNSLGECLVDNRVNIALLGQLVNLGRVELLDLNHFHGLFLRNQVQSHSSSSESSASSDSVNVVLHGHWEVHVDNQSTLSDINSSGQQISGQKQLDLSLSEILHDFVSDFHLQSSVHELARDFLLLEFLAELLASFLGVEIDEALRNRGVIENCHQGVVLGVLVLAVHVVLADSLECDVLVLDKDLHWVAQGLLCNGEDLLGHCGREEADLGLRIDGSDDLVDLFDESERKHFVGLVDDQELDGGHGDESFLEHSLDLSGGSDNHLTSFLESLSLGQLRASSDKQSDFDLHQFGEFLGLFINLPGEFSGGENNQNLLVLDGLVDSLQGADQKSGCLS